MINSVLKRIFAVFITLCILIIGIFLYLFNFYALPVNDSNDSAWSDFNKWFEWKRATNLTEEQRNVINYLKESSDIFEKAFRTQYVLSESKFGHPNPKEAIKIIKQSIFELEKLECPKVCQEYRNINIKNLEHINLYQKLRLDYKEGSEEFNEKYRELELNFIKSGINSKRHSEFFYCIKKIGLLDDYKKEIKKIEEGKDEGTVHKVPPH